MLTAQILAAVASLLHVYSMPIERKDNENGTGPLSFRKEGFNVSNEDGTKYATGRDYDIKPSMSRRYVRSPYQMGPSRPIETSKSYKFDYLIKSPKGDLQFRSEEGYHNGTVAGFYGHSEYEVGFLIVNYKADSNGYRATIQKEKSKPGERVVLLAQRGPDGIALEVKRHIYASTYVQAANEGFQYNNATSKEADDNYG